MKSSDFPDDVARAVFILLANYHVDPTICLATAKESAHIPDDEELDAITFLVLNHGWVVSAANVDIQ